MGKIRTRVIGIEDVEEKQKKVQKEKSAQKKIRAQGLKGGERMSTVEVDEASLAKMEKAKKIIQAEASKTKKETVQDKVKTITHVRGENYQKAKKLIDAKKSYTLNEAIKLLKKAKFSKFDESVELHLNVDETGLKGELTLPHSTGKTVRIKILDDKVLTNIEKGVIDFDVLITHPSFMPKLAKFAKVLGPKGLMPNPKAGTISPNPEEAAKKFSKGGLRWKTEAKFPLIHQMIGKLSFADKDLVENAEVFIASVGTGHIQRAVIKSTMSPGIRLAIVTKE